MAYEVKYTENAEKVIRKMEKNAAKSILAKIKKLAESPYKIVNTKAWGN